MKMYHLITIISLFSGLIVCNQDEPQKPDSPSIIPLMSGRQQEETEESSPTATPVISIGALKIDETILDALPYIKRLHELSQRDDVSALVLFINSGGGSASAGWAIADEVKRIRDEKPIIAFIYGDCASAAYLIASACNYVIATRGSLIGSIGTRFSIVRLRNQRMQRDNVVADFEEVVIARGKYKVVPRDEKFISAEEQQYINNLVDDGNDEFIKGVIENRAIQEAKLTIQNQNEWADGQLFIARKALELGLIDRLGSYSTLLDVCQALLTKRGRQPLGKFTLVYSDDEKEDNKKNDKKELSRGLGFLLC